MPDKLTGRGGPGRGQGRKVESNEYRRNQCGDIRLQQWLKDWLHDQPESAGRQIEKACIGWFNLVPPGKDE